MIPLRYGNTNTYYFPGENGGLLLDTDWAGTLSAFFRALKQNGLTLDAISHLLLTHCHGDHMGLAGELQRRGVRLVVTAEQLPHLHDPDPIFARDSRLAYLPADETAAEVITCADSRAYLAALGIAGEIIPIPSHSADSVSLVLDNGDCFVGDLEPLSYLAAYEGSNPALAADWQAILARHPRTVYHAHANAKML